MCGAKMDNEILSTLENGVRIIKINRPKKKNAMNANIYTKLAHLLNEDANNDKVSITIITGTGEYFSSGNDMVSALQDTDMDASLARVDTLIRAFIEYPKLLIAIVNGPAIGIAATTAALCDIVYASDKATFTTPFLNLGLCPEGASSFLFPRHLGRSRATEMLFFGKTLTAKEAYDCGFVAELFEHGKRDKLIEKLRAYGKLPVNAVKITKGLIIAGLKESLLAANEREMNGLRTCLESDDFLNTVTAFMNRKSKL